MRRQVCDVCGAVSIDLTGADNLTVPAVSTQRSILSQVRRR